MRHGSILVEYAVFLSRLPEGDFATTPVVLPVSAGGPPLSDVFHTQEDYDRLNTLVLEHFQHFVPVSRPLGVFIGKAGDELLDLIPFIPAEPGYCREPLDHLAITTRFVTGGNA